MNEKERERRGREGDRRRERGGGEKDGDGEGEREGMKAKFETTSARLVYLYSIGEKQVNCKLISNVN